MAIAVGALIVVVTSAVSSVPVSASPKIKPDRRFDSRSLGVVSTLTVAPCGCVVVQLRLAVPTVSSLSP
jgi:hypothetical protein